MYQCLSTLCVECNSLSCTCTDILNPNDDNDVNDCDSLISEAYSDESCNIILRAQPSTETINHSVRNTNNDSNSVSSVNLNLKKKGINIGFLNVQGICGKDMSKFSEINLMLTLHVFGMCESKLKEDKLSSAFKLSGFHTPFRKDNTLYGGEGIMVFVRKELMAKGRADLEVNNVGCLWIDISQRKGKSFLVGYLYRNPADKAEWAD